MEEMAVKTEMVAMVVMAMMVQMLQVILMSRELVEKVVLAAML